MEQDRGDQRERMAPALARRRRFGRIQALDRLGGEIGLGQNVAVSAAFLSRKRGCLSLANSFMGGQWPNLVTLPRAADWVMPSRMNLAGGGAAKRREI